MQRRARTHRYVSFLEGHSVDLGAIHAARARLRGLRMRHGVTRKRAYVGLLARTRSWWFCLFVWGGWCWRRRVADAACRFGEMMGGAMMPMGAYPANLLQQQQLAAMQQQQILQRQAMMAGAAAVAPTAAAVAPEAVPMQL